MPLHFSLISQQSVIERPLNPEVKPINATVPMDYGVYLSLLANNYRDRAMYDSATLFYNQALSNLVRVKSIGLVRSIKT